VVSSAGAALLLLLAEPAAAPARDLPTPPAISPPPTSDGTTTRAPAPTEAAAADPSPAPATESSASKPMRVALRDPFATPVRSGQARWTSPDLLDPFVAPSSRTTALSHDLRDPFAPLPGNRGRPTACRVRADGLVVQRPRVLRASAPACPPSDPALHDPFAAPVRASQATPRSATRDDAAQHEPAPRSTAPGS
jgi:hypothetical protein